MVRKRIPPLSHQPDASSFRIRTGMATDAPFVRDLSVEVFDQFGNYGTFLPLYLNHPYVVTGIAEIHGSRVGFIMVARVASTHSLPWCPGEPDENDEDAEVLAIAVLPEHQGARVGTRLMKYALDWAEDWSKAAGVRSVQLNVADTNSRGIAFFKKLGFVVVNPTDGTYPKGQRSIRMAIPMRE
jgi:ribosomal protein S18 acetylase RimI-like enzyme